MTAMAVEPTFSDRLKPADFRRLASFIEGYSGIRMPANKQTMVEGRLRRRVRALGLGTLDDYCRLLFTDGGLDREAVHLIDAVTTNKTEFFRESDHFTYLADKVLPPLVAEKRQTNGTVKVWSAACSTGAEPYTLAMVMDDYGLRTRPFRYSVLSTDICTEVLEQARTAIYSEAMIAPVPKEMRKRYLMRSKDKARQLVRVVPELRHHVGFARLNLIEDRYLVDRDMDVIFCRNILIYFDKPTQEAVLRRLCDHLVPGGHLFVGHTETVGGFDLPVRQVSTTVFMRL